MPIEITTNLYYRIETVADVLDFARILSDLGIDRELKIDGPVDLDVPVPGVPVPQPKPYTAVYDHEVRAAYFLFENDSDVSFTVPVGRNINIDFSVDDQPIGIEVLFPTD